jgi:endonuclease V-like protein UPF0215 family
VGARPHLLGIDDGPFEKHARADVPVVAVLMEGHDLVEGVAVTRFAVDGPDATGVLAAWIRGLRFHAGLQGIVLGGISVAGLGIVDVAGLAGRTGVPVLAVNRRDPAASTLPDALRAAGLADRIPLVERSPRAFQTGRGLWVTCAGLSDARAAALVESSLYKSDLPEPLRLAHLVAQAIALGESRGRV